VRSEEKKEKVMRVHKPLVFRVLAPVIAVAFVVSVAGCGGGADEDSATSYASNAASDTEYLTKSSQEVGVTTAAGAPAGAAPAGGAGFSAPQKAQGLERKIIYNANVSLVVEKLSPAQTKLQTLIRQYNGYIAESNVGGQSGSPRTATWKIRVPVTGYQNFLDAITKIGEVQTVSSNSSDVSEEFYDIEARLRNKRVEEKRLLEHLKRSTAKLSDILMVEKEISRVRGEIEQMTGRLRVLANLTSLTTISVTIQEIKDYVPPAPPTFSTEVSRTFHNSLGALSDFAKTILLGLIAIAPWLLVIGLIGLPVWKIAKRRLPSRKDHA
jgi:hypothetical protein